MSEGIKKYKIIMTVGNIEFIGKYRHDLEVENWHYYERDDGVIIHCRKEHMVCVLGDDAPGVIEVQKKKIVVPS